MPPAASLVPVRVPRARRGRRVDKLIAGTAVSDVTRERGAAGSPARGT